MMITVDIDQSYFSPFSDYFLSIVYLYFSLFVNILICIIYYTKHALVHVILFIISSRIEVSLKIKKRVNCVQMGI